jgi:hypothetical protein
MLMMNLTWNSVTALEDYKLLKRVTKKRLWDCCPEEVLSFTERFVSRTKRTTMVIDKFQSWAVTMTGEICF